MLFRSILQEEAQKARDIQIRALTDTQNAIREKLKERYDIIKTNVNRETQVYLQQSAEVVSKLNELQTLAVEFGNKVSANIKDAFQTTDDAVKDILDSVEKDLQESTALVEKLANSLRKLQEESQRRDIDIAIEDKSPGQQIGVLGAEVRRLTKTAISEKTFEGMENSFDQAKKYADQIKKITESTSKERTKIEKQIAAEQKRYQAADTKLRKEQDKSRGDTRKGIQEQRILLKGEYSKTIDELQSKLSELGSLPITVDQADNAIKNISKIQEAEYRKRGSAAFKIEQENVIKQETFKRIQDEISQIQRLENNTKFSDIIKLENEKELKSTFAEREALMQRQLALLEDLKRRDVDNANVTKNIETIKTKLAYEQAAVKSNLAKREELSAQNVAKAKEEAFLLSVTAIKEEEVAAQKNLQRLERQKAIGEAQAADDLKRQKLLFGTNYLDEAALRRQSFAKAGVVDPDQLDQAITTTKDNLEKSRKTINDFLNALPPSIRESVKAQISQTAVVQTLTEKIGAASTAQTDYITSLKNLEKQTGATAAYLADLRANLPPITPISTPVTNPPGSAAGGIAPRGRDNLLALLSPGEYVMNAKSTRKFYSQLVAMNAGIPGFASGGLVGNTFTGDFNISLQSSGNETVDVQRIGKLLQREIRRGTVVL